RRRVRDEIREIQQKLGLTVVYVTHDQEEALAVSDRIIVMNNAAIAQDGTPRDLYEAPANAFVAEFIGEADLLDCALDCVACRRAATRPVPPSWQRARGVWRSAPKARPTAFRARSRR